MTPRPVNAMLVLYSRQRIRRVHEASTVEEHYGAFRRHSRFRVFEWNARLGYPEALDAIDPAVVVLHYSLFGSGIYILDDRLLEFLTSTRARKIAFFQDENSWMRKRFQFVDDYGIDAVYTHIAEAHFDATWRRHTRVPEVVHNYPGYVSDALSAGARRWGLPDESRDVDVGYRGRALPVWLGRASQEKTLVGEGFARRAAGSGLRLDIATAEQARIYGRAWHRFMGRCRAMLGVESGVSYLDLDDEVLTEYERLLAEQGSAPTLAQLEEGALGRLDGNFPYRTIGPRHLEAAAFSTCQVLFTGRYAGLLRPHVHYIPLEKDFSNVDDVIAALRDDRVRREIASNARRDLIESGRLSYARFVDDFDRRLMAHGLEPRIARRDQAALARALATMPASNAYRRVRRFVRRELPWHAYRVIAPVSKKVRRTLHLPQKDP